MARRIFGVSAEIRQLRGNVLRYPVDTGSVPVNDAGLAADIFSYELPEHQKVVPASISEFGGQSVNGAVENSQGKVVIRILNLGQVSFCIKDIRKHGKPLPEVFSLGNRVP